MQWAAPCRRPTTCNPPNREGRGLCGYFFRPFSLKASRQPAFWRRPVPPIRWLLLILVGAVWLPGEASPAGPRPPAVPRPSGKPRVKPSGPAQCCRRLGGLIYCPDARIGRLNSYGGPRRAATIGPVEARPEDAAPDPKTAWRRTRDGWERPTWWRPAGPSRRPGLHPIVVGLLELLLALGALIGFSGPSNRPT